MPRDPRLLLYVGIKNRVVALDASSGAEVWRAELRSSDYVNVLWDGTALFAANSGEVWRLDPQTGAALWRNEMKGLGRGLVSLASSQYGTGSSDSKTAADKRRRDAATAAATAG
jgi:outer membrane protein assembly factor BamB